MLEVMSRKRNKRERRKLATHPRRTLRGLMENLALPFRLHVVGWVIG